MAVDPSRTTEDPWKCTFEESLTDGHTGTRVFNIYCDQPEIVPNILPSVVAACPVGLGGLFPGSLISQCVTRTPALLDETLSAFTVTCQYKSILNQIEQSRIDYPNPLDRTVRINWSARTVMTAVTRLQKAMNGSSVAYKLFDPAVWTFDGKPYSAANSASDPFDPPIEVPTTEWIVSVTKNVTVPPTWALTYENAVNDADFTLDGLTVPKGCAKLEGIRIGEVQREGGIAFRQLTFSVVLRAARELRTGESKAPEPWDVEVLDEGMRTFEPGVFSGGKWKNIKDSSGQGVGKPVHLNGSGVPIDPDGNPIPESSLYWILFRPFKRKDFSVLPLV